MFYSHDLLGRKTPLGAIWLLAHGKKLPKGKINNMNVLELCQEILQPGVPHSLRLQSTLLGGLVILFSKQQSYLLDDLLEMMRRIKTTYAALPPGQEEGGLRPKGTTLLKQSRDRARLETITLLDGGGIDMDGPGMLLLGLEEGSAGLGMELSDELFMMPTLDDSGPLTSYEDARRSAGNTHNASGASKHRGDGSKGLHLFGSKLRSGMAGGAAVGAGPSTAAGTTDKEGGGTASGGAMQQLHEEQQWQPEDEMFEVPEDFNLFDDPWDMAPAQQEEGEPHPPGADSDAGTGFPAAAAGGGGGVGDSHRGTSSNGLLGLSDQQQGLEFDMEDPEQEVMHPGQVEVEVEEGEGMATPQPAATAAAKAKAGGGRFKRKVNQIIVDDLEDLQIKSKLYREWVLDQSELTTSRPAKRAIYGPAAAAAGGGKNGGVMPQPQQAMLGMELNPWGLLVTGPAAAAGGGGGVGSGGPWCGELLSLFRACQDVGPVGADSPDANNAAGTGELPVQRTRARKPRDTGEQYGEVPLELVEGPEEGGLGWEEEPVMEEEHDQLMDLPFAGDVEVERLRDAAPTPSGSRGPALSSPSHSGATTTSTTPGGGGRRHSSAALTSRGTSAGTRPSSSDVGGLSLRRGLHLGSSALQEYLRDVESPVAYGLGALEDLLPQVPDLAPSDSHLQHSGLPHSTSLAASHGGNSHSLGGLGRLATGVVGGSGLGGGTSQFPLMEESAAPDTQLMPEASVTRHTMLVLQILRQRFLAAAGGGAGGSEGGGGGDMAVSFRSLVRAGQLSRMETAKLFYQVCVTTSSGWVKSEQVTPFGDITLRPGRLM